MIIGVSRSFARGKGHKLLFQPEQNFKNGYGLYCLWKISGGSAPKFPLDPPLVTEVANVDSTDIDADSLMKSTN